MLTGTQNIGVFYFI